MSAAFDSVRRVSEVTGFPLFEQRDVSLWRVVGEEFLGTKPKRWLAPGPADDGEVLWLMKDRTLSESDKFGTYPKGDDWSERIAAAVASAMDVPAAHVELAIKHVEGAPPLVGVISKRIHDDNDSLVHGNELLQDYRGTSNAWDMTGYSLEAVEKALRNVGPPAQSDWHSAWHLFVGYVLLDAVIGNTDRHPENWAAVDSGDSANRTLAPSFDHASCLGFQLAAGDKAERLLSRDKNRHPEVWASKARTHFEGKPTTTQLALDALSTLAGGTARDLLNRIPTATQLDRLVDSVPDERMSDPDREFAKRMMRANVKRLTSMSH